MSEDDGESPPVVSPLSTICLSSSALHSAAIRGHGPGDPATRSLAGHHGSPLNVRRDVFIVSIYKLTTRFAPKWVALSL